MSQAIQYMKPDAAFLKNRIFKNVSGYMPRAYQFGFIYNQYDNIRTIAHELSHGAFHLKHTFAAGDDYIAPEETTDNLMDYAGGVTLNHWQWQDIHLPKSVRFKWLQDEAGAEAWGEGTRYKCINTELANKIKSKHRYFYYPDGSIVDMDDHVPSGFYLSDDVDAKTSSSKAELIFFQNICGLPEDWASKRISTIEKYGEEGFNLLKELKIDYSSMGPDAFEMLSLCVKNASKESINKFKAVLS